MTSLQNLTLYLHMYTYLQMKAYWIHPKAHLVQYPVSYHDPKASLEAHIELLNLEVVYRNKPPLIDLP